MFIVEVVNMYAYSSYLEVLKVDNLDDVYKYADSYNLTIKKIYKAEELPIKD